MAGDIVEDRARAKAEQWREHIAEQQSSGLSIKQFCKERGLTLWTFYDWRKRLREAGPVRFALVERGSRPEASCSSHADLEVVFATGERLHIRRGVDGATLRTVVEVLRG
jgi:transposase